MKKKDGDYSKEQLNSHKLQKRKLMMNSHIDIQKQTHKQWLSLTEYSQKHNVSISTLRRRIRSGTITVKLEDGKYFIVDDQQNADLLQGQSTEDSKTPDCSTEDMKPNSFIDKLLITQQELYRLLAEKDKKNEFLQLQISDFNTLVALLEKENSQMKSQLEQEKNLEEWLNK